MSIGAVLNVMPGILPQLPKMFAPHDCQLIPRRQLACSGNFLKFIIFSKIGIEKPFDLCYNKVYANLKLLSRR